MKTVSIRDLHARTGAIAREAAKRPLQITDRGRVVAVIQAPSVASSQGVPLPDREASIALVLHSHDTHVLQAAAAFGLKGVDVLP